MQCYLKAFLTHDSCVWNNPVCTQNLIIRSCVHRPLLRLALIFVTSQKHTHIQTFRNSYSLFVVISQYCEYRYVGINFHANTRLSFVSQQHVRLCIKLPFLIWHKRQLVNFKLVHFTRSPNNLCQLSQKFDIKQHYATSFVQQ